jgi:xanthine/CO dehydrogenase XdhC/CoxF family maturation factor
VVSHVFEADKAALGVLLESPLGYLGLQGNRKRSERILRELAEENGPLSDHGRAILHYPAGLDIGAESPEIIALSMVSEVQATLAGRLGSPLRDRPGAIH